MERTEAYALEGAFSGFATDTAISALTNPNIVMFSERYSSACEGKHSQQIGFPQKRKALSFYCCSVVPSWEINFGGGRASFRRTLMKFFSLSRFSEYLKEKLNKTSL